MKDHLGNNRITFAADNETITLVQSVNYYPYGKTFGEYVRNSKTANLFLYNGKELQNDVDNSDDNLDLLDYGARFYDMIVPHFGQIDPKAEQFPWQSPYCYAANNPVKFIDENGEFPWGAVIGAAVELGTQMAVNYATGNDIMDIYYGDVAIAAVSGLVTGGLDKVAAAYKTYNKVEKVVNTAKKVVSVAEEVTKAGVDVKGNLDKQDVQTVGGVGGYKEKSNGAVVVDLLAGPSGSGTGKVTSEVLNSSGQSSLKKAEQRITRTATGSKNNIEAKSQKAEIESTMKANAQVAKHTTSVAAGYIGEKIKKN